MSPPDPQALADSLFSQVREELLEAARQTPLSCYRVQLNKDFRFQDAQAQVAYLDRLGITDLYSSPCLKAVPGSNHGYDVLDHLEINPEIGTDADHQALSDALRARGMGQVLDVVPNHMGIDGENPLWLDVLENGPSSLYAKYFDVDWDPVKDELRDKVLLPVLGDQYGKVLENGELQLEFDPTGGAFRLCYWDRRFPIAPRQYLPLISHQLPQLAAVLGEDHDDYLELLSILTALEHLPPRTGTERLKVVERNREKQVIKRRLAVLVSRNAEVLRHLQRNVTVFNGQKGDPRSFDRLDELLEHCSYRLAHWRVAGEEINYRRFFDINGLAAIRVEDPEVFEHAHRLIFRFLRQGRITGLRIDHPDGLFDPTAYFLNLQEQNLVERTRARAEATGVELRLWPQLEGRLRQRFRDELAAEPEGVLRRSLYVVVEKIQGGRERIPEDWAVHGTVGYRFAHAVTGLFVDRDQERPLTDAYHRFLGRELDFDALLYEKKRLILSSAMASEVNVLARELNRISELDRRTRDFTLNSLRRALVEFIALFPVYRTYVDDWRGLDERDVRYVEWTIARAKRRDPNTNATIFDFLKDVLLRRYPEHVGEAEKAVMLRFAMKLQQVTGPVMAKGLEDTAFYIYNRLTSLNEVGGEPERFGTTPATFHLRNQERAEYWPASFLTSSTHDTKRSEDVRARISVISELPELWSAGLERWARLNAAHKQTIHDAPAPDANEEYLLYQTLLGAWPMGEEVPEAEWETFRQRLGAYLAKAIREAKVNTSWLNPNPEYDEAVARFVERVTDRQQSREFLADFEAFKRRVEAPGQLSSLSQLLLKITSPGAPDIYQGNELWDLSLVDPDNRRTVDYAHRSALLDSLDRRAREDRAALCRELTGELKTGAIKLFTLAEGLRLRRRKPELFRRGGYLPLDLEGHRADRAIAYVRRHQQDQVVVLVPRLVATLQDSQGQLAPAFRKTWLQLPDELEGATLVHVYTHQTFRPTRVEGRVGLDVAALLAHYPVTLLEKVKG
ncbi:MAG: malto-oligosyltrehalose synthase [Myxococcota bacterium]|nr:malto-oligosyltrehalose synthase [Myxococcota bacterium]